MKKKLFIIFLTVMASACFALGLSACTGSSEQGSGDGHTHNISYVAAEAATCTQDGHAEYWYCADCGKYFTDAEGNNETTIAQLEIPATGHTPADSVRENEVAATCTAEGSYDEVIYCEACDEEISRTSKTIDKLSHTPADPVRENEVPATCTAEGSYDEVVYCEICDTEISRTSKTIDKLAHTYSDEWSYDDTYHWHAAICCDTGAVSDKAVHAVEGGVCTVCNAFVGTTGLKYTISDDKTYYIVSGRGTATDANLIIPPEHNGLPVTTIGNFAFKNCDSLTSITLPNSVTSIGLEAFYDCTSLISVTIGNNITYIGDNAFYYCYKLIEVYNLSSLNIAAGSSDNGYVAYYAQVVHTSQTETSRLSITQDGFIVYLNDVENEYYLMGYAGNESVITLPNSIKGNAYEIYDYAFYECNLLENVTIDNGVTSIGDEAFRYCYSLESITISDSVTSIGKGAFDGCTNITMGTMPVAAINYIPQVSLQTVIITSGESIGNSAFKDCTSLESITIPDSVVSIGRSAFKDCTSLESITIPDSVVSIDRSAFYDCTSLKSVTIGNGITSIGEDAFYGCSSLVSIYYQGDITSWCGIKFKNALSNPLAGNLYLSGELVTELVIPDNVTSIGNYTFADCDSLESITIPNSVTSIGKGAFSNCASLKRITIPDSVTAIGDSAFGGCASLESITIGDGATSIGAYAFYNCTSLKLITIGDSVTSIGNYAFYGCFSLESITIPDSVTSIGEDAFEGCTNLIQTEYVVRYVDRWVIG